MFRFYVALISILIVIGVARSTLPSKATNISPGANPKLTVYRGVLTVAPGEAGDSVFELGNAGRDVASTGDIYLRPNSSTAGSKLTRNLLGYCSATTTQNCTLDRDCPVGQSCIGAQSLLLTGEIASGFYPGAPERSAFYFTPGRGGVLPAGLWVGGLCEIPSNCGAAGGCPCTTLYGESCTVAQNRRFCTPASTAINARGNSTVVTAAVDGSTQELITEAVLGVNQKAVDTGSSYGVRGSGGRGAQSYGVYGIGGAVDAPNVTYGIYGEAAASGTGTKWAGYFKGNARTENDFYVGGQFCFGTLGSTDCRNTWAGIGGGSQNLDQVLAVGNTAFVKTAVLSDLGLNQQGLIASNVGNSNYAFLVPSLGNGGYSNLSLPGDAGLFFHDSGGFVLAPWAANSEGIRITPTGSLGIGINGAIGKLVVGNNLTGTGSSGDAIAAYANTSNSALYAQQDNSSGYAAYLSGRLMAFTNSTDNRFGVQVFEQNSNAYAAYISKTPSDTVDTVHIRNGTQAPDFFGLANALSTWGRVYIRTSGGVWTFDQNDALKILAATNGSGAAIWAVAGSRADFAGRFNGTIQVRGQSGTSTLQNDYPPVGKPGVLDVRGGTFGSHNYNVGIYTNAEFMATYGATGLYATVADAPAGKFGYAIQAVNLNTGAGVNYAGYFVGQLRKKGRTGQPSNNGLEVTTFGITTGLATEDQCTEVCVNAGQTCALSWVGDPPAFGACGTVASGRSCLCR